MELNLNLRQYLELEKIALGAFAPLNGFMNEAQFPGVVDNMRLPDGQVFPLPVVLDVTAAQARAGSRVSLLFNGDQVGEMTVESAFTCDKDKVCAKLFSVSDPKHPGIAHFHRMGTHFLGGPVRQTRRMSFDFSRHELTPEQTKAHFKARGWKTVAGFQTRNVPHRAHEYQQRMALSLVDGLFIQPLVGRKKRGDCRPEAILASYRALIDGFLPAERVLLGVLSTYMRYAGPREAVFHAIIRRNYGCTHFIVGRDHAGVGDYYGKYAAQDLIRGLSAELGIEVLCFPGPFHCKLCDGIVTELTCPHTRTAPAQVREISGTDIRAVLSGKGAVAPEIMRPEVVKSIAGMPLFIEEDGE